MFVPEAAILPAMTPRLSGRHGDLAMIILGLDIGSNSVGSAWVDTDKLEVHLAASVFPAGVDEQEDKRGAPKNQDRRQTRSQRRTIGRRARRKRRLTQFLVEQRLLPSDDQALRDLFNLDPWLLRSKALREALSPHEFGRVLIHLAQRRGAIGVTTDPEDPDEGKVKEGMDRLDKLMQERGTETVGDLLARLIEERRHKLNGITWNDPIRNRQYRMPEDRQLYAGREWVRKEFYRIVEVQRALKGSSLSSMLTDDLVNALDDPARTDTWRHGGLLFGQRRTYWDTGTLGRCVLEPTERCVPEADMHAQEYRVIEYANNLRVRGPGEDWRSMTAAEREAVIRKLRSPILKKSKGEWVPKKSATIEDVREALGYAKARRKGVESFEIKQESSDPDRAPNTDWFHREIVHGALTEARWNDMTAAQREAVNKAILKFDPADPGDVDRLRTGAVAWWGLDAASAERFVTAWSTRPKLEKRLKLSRSAIRNVLPHMSTWLPVPGRWPTQIEARQMFAEDAANGATMDQRRRYLIGAPTLTKADRYFIRKHPDLLPPAPMLSNPVVRKAIHEVRRVLVAWRRSMKVWPDRIVLEYTRSATQPEKIRNEQLSLNRRRNKLRQAVLVDFQLEAESTNQQERAIQRVLLCRQQRGLCPYCHSTEAFSEKAAVDGTDLEVDHIVPRSRSQDNGLNNKMLVHRTCNRGKGNRTVKEWMSPEQFALMEQRLQHLQHREPVEEYFTQRDYARKWQNLHREAPSIGEFLNSQFSDTAYATRQVGQWIRDALYGGETDGRRCVLTTKGPYTAILRKDWGLLEDVLDRHWLIHGDGTDGTQGQNSGGPDDARKARREKGKDRRVHFHHAIDALAIALAPAKLQELAHIAEAQELYRAEQGRWPRPAPLPPPWPAVNRNANEEEVLGAIQEFRRQVTDAAEKIIVSHRPVKRRLVGAFHKETMYGPVPGDPTTYTSRIPVAELKPGYLKLSRKQMDDLGAGTRPRAGDDPSIDSNSYLVRDLDLRLRIRQCLEEAGVDPDGFTDRQIKPLALEGKIRMASGVPIKSAICLKTIADPVRVTRKRWDASTNSIIQIAHPKADRIYVAGNNHHIEVRENPLSGRWTGTVVRTFEAARRVRIEARDPVDRSDQDDGRFIMSLAEGEVICARRKDRPHDMPGAVGYFVVCKIDPNGKVHFAPHWDARRAADQDRWAATPSGLKACEPQPGTAPYKVHISPLGEDRKLEKD